MKRILLLIVLISSYIASMISLFILSAHVVFIYAFTRKIFPAELSIQIIWYIIPMVLVGVTITLQIIYNKYKRSFLE